MQGIKIMLLGIMIIVSSMALYSIYDDDLVACLIAILGICIGISGYFHDDKKD